MISGPRTERWRVCLLSAVGEGDTVPSSPREVTAGTRSCGDSTSKRRGSVLRFWRPEPGPLLTCPRQARDDGEATCPLAHPGSSHVGHGHASVTALWTCNPSAGDGPPHAHSLHGALPTGAGLRATRCMGRGGDMLFGNTPLGNLK